MKTHETEMSRAHRHGWRYWSTVRMAGMCVAVMRRTGCPRQIVITTDGQMRSTGFNETKSTDYYR